MKRFAYIAVVAALSLPTILSAQDSSAGRPLGRKLPKSAQILMLQRMVDSLQTAYDSLYVEYQTLLAPVNMDDAEDIVQDTTAVEYTADNIDSLLTAFYSIQQPLEEYAYDFRDMDRDSLSSDIPDSVYVARLKALNSFIPLQFNRYVKNNIIRYTEKIPNTTARIIGLASFYLPRFEEILDQHDMPKELKAMAIIESALNTKAVSRARAKGMWQFMYTTGRKYGLNITSFVDERFDANKSCHAAAQYLKDAYLIFGDWQLAIASYNCGAGNVRKAIRRSGGKTDFWDIYNYLPRETRGYIPAFIAALYVLEYYPEHGIVPAQVTLPSVIDTFHINRRLHFGQISENIGISVETLRELNPQYIHDIIPGNENEYVLALPFNYTTAFVDRENDIYGYKDSVFFNEVAIKKIKDAGGNDGTRIIHKVRSGETLGGIAAKYHTSVKNIRRWNGIKGNTIRVGQKLAIYGNASSVKSQGKSGSAAGGSASTYISNGYVMYKVRSGDNLTVIAKRTRTTVQKLREINGFPQKYTLKAGQHIKIREAD